MGEREETRKIQFTGKSSYIVSLPKQWITDLGLKRGDQLRMMRDGSSVLQIYPPKYQTRGMPAEAVTIEIGPEEASHTIVRKLISLYFLGLNTINVNPKSGRLRPDQRTAVKDAVRRMLMGTEIISDHTGGITIQVLVNLLELSVNGAFKRMLHLTVSMLDDVMLAMRENNMDLAREIISTDDEVDRFGFYIIRQLKIAIQNEHMLKELGFSNARQCLGYRLVVKSIERAGDHATRIAYDLLEFKKEMRPEIMDKIQDMSKFALSVLDDACLSLFKEDYLQAEETIEKAKLIFEYETHVTDVAKSLDAEDLYRARRITEDIRRVAEYASDIAEIVLNINIEKALKKKA